jgi:hypothetical protein
MTQEWEPKVGELVECLHEGQWEPGKILTTTPPKRSQITGPWLCVRLETGEMLPGLKLENLRLAGSQDYPC